MEKVQKLINFEDLIQENQKEEILPEEQWPAQGKISFNNMTLRYRPETELVLKEVDFKIEAGMKVGIVGRTGAGKSTIALTLSRILELESGNIEIDGIDIAKVGL